MSFKFTRLEIPDVLRIETDIFKDSRGFFLEIFKCSDFKAVSEAHSFVQINHSQSQKNVLRGLHFQQAPASQGKLMTVISGTIFDVGVDIRKNSPTYGKWIGEELSSEKRTMLFLPSGFAHGYCVLSDSAQIIYYCTENEYSPQHEQTIIWNDPEIAINWPIKDPILSDKDKQGSLLKDL